MRTTTANPTTDRPRLRALLAEFDSPGALLAAAERVRDAGYTKWDTHSPFPVHGIDEAMGIRPTLLPWIVFLCGALGCATGVALQWWTNATQPADFSFLPTEYQGYDFQISGKPLFSLPANIPVIFEVTVLLSAFAAVVGMLVLNNLPRHFNPLHQLARFRRVTVDRFFVRIDAHDPRFDATSTGRFLSSIGALALDRVEDVDAPSRLPRGLIIAPMILACLALLPPLFVAKARLAKSERPRLHIIQDMDNQERYKAQQANAIFADGRAMRPTPAGTVARGDLRPDAHYSEGKVGDTWAATFPAQIELSETFVRRGQQRFNIYCAPCHGLGGAGDGIVSKRAVELETPGWTVPTALIDPKVVEQPHGQIFNTITSGLRTMPPYGDQIAEADRWAIVAYVRALQRSQNARLEEVPEEVRAELRVK